MNYNHPPKHKWLPPVVAVIVLFLIVGGIVFLVCNKHKPQERVASVAQKALMASVDRPESVKILAVSKVDSVFNRDYISMDEKVAISMAMMKVNEKVMKETDGFDNFDLADPSLAALMERQMSAMNILRSLTSQSVITAHGKPVRRFTGWKVKIEYEAQSENGKSYRSEYWFILDKDAQCVVKSFEVPLV